LLLDWKSWSPKMGSSEQRRIRRNGPENAFEVKAIENGWDVTKRGWPDFLCFKGSRVIAVEVKPLSKATGKLQYLKLAQVRTMLWLSSVGVECYVSNGEQIEKFSLKKHGNPKHWPVRKLLEENREHLTDWFRLK